MPDISSRLSVAENHAAPDLEANAQSLRQAGFKREQLEQLYQYQIIDEKALNYALEILLPPRQWVLWMMRLAVGLGAALVLIGVVFFFAYNWAEMSKWAKFAVLQAAMVLCFAVALLVGVRKLAGQSLLLAGTVLIGVFFAVFGQIYQTGADAWQLFALWAVLMLGFVGLSHFPAQWALQWIITGLALFLWFSQTLTSLSYNLGSLLICALMSGYCLLLWLAQMHLRQHWRWLDCAWLHYLALLAVQWFVLLYFGIALFNDFIFLVFLPAPAVMAALLFWHRRQRDFAGLVMGLVSLSIMLWLLILYSAIEWVGWHSFTAPVAIMLLVTIALSVALYQVVLMLKRQHETQAGQS